MYDKKDLLKFMFLLIKRKCKCIYKYYWFLKIVILKSGEFFILEFLELYILFLLFRFSKNFLILILFNLISNVLKY